MTAIVMCELVDDMSETIVATKEMVTVEGSSMGLLPGDTVSYHDLLYGLLLASGNDAANTIAISLCGSLDAFVEKTLGKLSTYPFQNPFVCFFEGMLFLRGTFVFLRGTFVFLRGTFGKVPLILPSKPFAVWVLAKF